MAGAEELELNRETVNFIIDKAREFQVSEGMSSEGDTASPADGWSSAGTDEGGPGRAELRATVDDLEPDQQVALVALMWIGRGDYVGDNRKEATRRLNRRVEIRPAPRQLQVVGPDLPHPADEHLALSSKDRLRVGRYSQLAAVPRPGQANPLQTIISLIFPGQIRTVGAALNHVLARSGWALAPTQASDPTIPYLMSLQLPESQRSLGPIALFDALAVLCGEAFVIVVDPVNRLVSCELRAPYSRLARAEEGVPAPYDNPKAGH